MTDIIIVLSNLGGLTLIEMNIIIKSLLDYLYNEKNEKKF